MKSTPVSANNWPFILRTITVFPMLRASKSLPVTLEFVSK